MNVDYCKRAVAQIEAAGRDDEAAHSREDELRAEFIQYIARANLGDVSQMAAEILKSDAIGFCRWCA